MEIRNIQKTGGSSFSLTLPKNWIKKFNLKDKDKIIIDAQKSGSLLVLPYFMKKSESRSILKITNLSEDVIIREITAYYLSGIDVIILKTDKFLPEQVSFIKNTVKNLLGMEILEQTANTIVIKNIFDNSKFSIVDNVNEMFVMIITMSNDIFEALEKRNKNLALNIIERDIEVNKLYLTIVRQFNLLLQNRITEEDINLSLIDLKYYGDIATQLERIADHTVKIAHMVILQSKRSHDVFTHTLKRKTKKISFFLRQVEETYRTLDRKTAHEIVDFQRYLSKNIHINKGIVKKTSIDIIIEDSIDRIRGYIENIAEEAIDYITLKQNSALISSDSI